MPCLSSVDWFHQFRKNVHANQERIETSFGLNVECDRIVSKADEEYVAVLDNDELPNNASEDSPEGQLSESTERSGAISALSATEKIGLDGDNEPHPKKRRERKASVKKGNKEIKNRRDTSPKTIRNIGGLGLEKTAQYLDSSLEPDIRQRFLDVTRTKKELSVANVHLRPVLEKEMIRMKLNYCHLCRNQGDDPAEYFDKFFDLKKHFSELHPSRKVSIYCCGQEHVEWGRAFDHVRWHLDNESFKCPYCDEMARKHMVQLLEHINRVHLPAKAFLRCPKCNGKFIIPAKLESHLRAPCVYTCDKCPKEFVRQAYLRRHVETAHAQVKRYKRPTYICPNCGVGHHSRFSLDVHMKVHDPSRQKIPCDICGLLVFDVVDHKKRMHRPPEEPAPCPKCGKPFKNEGRLKAHLYNVHREKKQFPCSVCDKVFTLKRYRKEHMSTHSGIPNYACYFCDEQFNHLPSRTHHHRKKHGPEYIEYKKRRFVVLEQQCPQGNRDTEDGADNLLQS